MDEKIEPGPGPVNIYADPPISHPRLHIGLLLDSCVVYAWVSKIVEDILRSPYLSLSLVIVNDTPPPEPQSFWKRLKSLWPTILYRIYFKLEPKFCPGDAFAQTDLSPLITNVPTIRVRPIQTKHTDRFELADIRNIQEANLDVLIRFGFRILKGDILRCAKYGIWSYHHDDNREYRGAPPLFWEIYEKNPASGSILQILSEQLDGGRIIYRSSSATCFRSWTRNRNGNYWKTADFVGRRLRELYALGWQGIQALPCYNESISYSKPIYRLPTNGVMAKFVCRQAMFLVKRQSQKLWKHRGYLGIQRLGSEAPASNEHDINIIRPPSRHSYACPFLFTHQGRTLMFFEDYVYADKKSSISMAELDGNGRISEPRKVLERPYRLSYPFIFRWGSEIFMLTEARQKRRVEVYVAQEFPYEWKLDRVLLQDVDAHGPTLVERNGKFWLFVNLVLPRTTSHDELFLFYSDSPFGTWRPHLRNPVISDVRSARPAGKIFDQDGMLIRPSQDCSVSDGHKIRLNRIDVLSETDYYETQIAELLPDWIHGGTATHAIAQNESFRVFDCSLPELRLIPDFLRRKRQPASIQLDQEVAGVVHQS